MRKFPYHYLSAVLLVGVLASCSSNAGKESAAAKESPAPQQTTAGTPPVARGSAASMQVSLSVVAVDATKRLITLKGPEGNQEEFEVGEQVKRLPEIKVGDTIHGTYDVGAVAELREPTAEEKASPAVEVTSTDRAPEDQPPAGGLGRVVRVVTTIESLDQANQSIVVKGPEGNTVSAHVEDPTVFSHLQPGQNIVVTFAEKLVLVVEPGKKK